MKNDKIKKSVIYHLNFIIIKKCQVKYISEQQEICIETNPEYNYTVVLYANTKHETKNLNTSESNLSRRN
jgi:hypothetical protein